MLVTSGADWDKTWLGDVVLTGVVARLHAPMSSIMDNNATGRIGENSLRGMICFIDAIFPEA